jgi:hypothetical protein
MVIFSLTHVPHTKKEKDKKKSRAKRHARKVDKRLAQLFKEPHPPILLRPPFFIIHT